MTPTTDCRYDWLSDSHELRACFPLMRVLRPHLSDADDFLRRLQRQAEQGYRLLAARAGDEVLGLAGCRLQENLLHGRFFYVDDLITREDLRSQGIGEQLLAEVRTEASRLGCANLVLDTALGNARGQRFYYRQGLLAIGMHFREEL
ncbi:GNAT family N-acetyltransferase [Ectopseudomonas mendocina]|uniref:GNAT family N-acetyltransferase n=1 Tax=Ectopseudomonas mendocina TaxID=300 RepID=A0A2R3QQD7_ECTME|nr:GNAT family N-acetyltransferase [Pseudomonas mendocina]AVO53995.1 GNAT family N-acetyltransferase [Pseudomonas mendocina]